MIATGAGGTGVRGIVAAVVHAAGIIRILATGVGVAAHTTTAVRVDSATIYRWIYTATIGTAITTDYKVIATNLVNYAATPYSRMKTLLSGCTAVNTPIKVLSTHITTSLCMA